MRRGLLIGLLLAVASAAQAQTLYFDGNGPAFVVMGDTAAQTPLTFTLGQALTASWDGTVAETAEGITAYQVRVDSGAWVSNGQTVPQTRYSYSLPQNLLTLGTHVVAVRACAGAVCGGTADELQVSISIERPRPGRPRNGTVTPTSGQALALPVAIDLANAYATLAVGRPLTGGELAELARRHGNQPPTRESVFAVLDAAFAELSAP